MDINVKLWELKYNFGKVQGCFAKKPWHGDFLILWNYFTKEKSWNMSTRP
jgi:hypothetical protein